MRKVVISVFITSLVSCLAGLIFIEKFWVIFAFAFIAQVLFFYFYNTIYENRLKEKAALIYNEQIKEENKCVVDVECPCKKHIERVLYRFDQQVSFKCPVCQNTVKVEADVKAILVTTPVNKLNDQRT